jgi:predicted metal-dependent hydrolase
MQKELTFQNKNIPYSVRVSRRARHMRLAVYCDSSVVLTLPLGLDLGRAEKFIESKLAWIAKSLERFRPFKNRPAIKLGRRDYKKHRVEALSIAKAKVEQWNNIYGFSYNRVNIKNQKTRWGSCSKKGNLNFNYKIAHLPEPLVDYLIVHELCHLKEFNHSKNFWSLVAKTIPNYKILRKELHNFNIGLS